MTGFIYIMTNKAFPGRLKIGISGSHPKNDRQSQLYSTGVPEPYDLQYAALVDEYEKIERKVHAQLSYKRPNKDREFFQCSVPEAIAVIREIAQIKYEDVYYKSPDEIKKAQEDREFECFKKY